MNGPTDFEMISVEDYYKIPGQSLSLEELHKMARASSTCRVCEGLPTWRLGGLGMCFPCMIGESDASGTHELVYEGEYT